MVNMPLFLLFMLLALVIGWYGVVLLRKWLKPGNAPWKTLLYLVSALILGFFYILLMFSLFFYFNGPLRAH